MGQTSVFQVRQALHTVQTAVRYMILLLLTHAASAYRDAIVPQGSFETTCSALQAGLQRRRGCSSCVDHGLG